MAGGGWLRRRRRVLAAARSLTARAAIRPTGWRQFDRCRDRAARVRARRAKSFSIMARRSTTWPSVPCTASSAFWVRAISLLEFDDAGRVFFAQAAGVFVGADFFDVDQKIGEAALDGFEMAEARVGGVQPLHQRDDLILEMTGRDIVAARLLDLLDLVGQRLDQRFQPRRHRAAVLRAFGQRIGQRRDAVFEIVERVAGAGCAAP